MDAPKSCPRTLKERMQRIDSIERTHRVQNLTGVIDMLTNDPSIPVREVSTMMKRAIIMVLEMELNERNRKLSIDKTLEGYLLRRRRRLGLIDEGWIEGDD